MLAFLNLFWMLLGSTERGQGGWLYWLSFDVPEGTLVTLVGSNGAGKTTTLRAISGLLPASRGNILFQEPDLQEHDLAQLASDAIVALGVTHVPEGSQLWPKMSVEENLELGAFLPRARAGRRASLDRVYRLFPTFGSAGGSRPERCRAVSGKCALSLEA
jgi:ABC-type branched-subunit amino acid transport system ATPase component